MVTVPYHRYYIYEEVKLLHMFSKFYALIMKLMIKELKLNVKIGHIHYLSLNVISLSYHLTLNNRALITEVLNNLQSIGSYTYGNFFIQVE
jgi:hypothetical protein